MLSCPVLRMHITSQEDSVQQLLLLWSINVASDKLTVHLLLLPCMWQVLCPQLCHH